MLTKAAILPEIGAEWEIQEIELGDPIVGEVQVRLAASGLCHSDEHMATGASPVPFLPLLGGHEGAGVVTKVGPGVRGIEEGDHVVLAFTPACGTCRPCASGLQNLCDEGAGLMTGRSIADGSFRAKTPDGKPLLQMCLLGTFAPYVTVNQASVVKIEKDIPLEAAALLGCGVSTGWGSATAIGRTRPGDTVVVVGIGGVGINAVQGAAAAGARYVVAVDPVAFKQKKALEFGATHVFDSMADAQAALPDLTWGRLAELVVLTVGEVEGHHIQEALSLTAKGGQVVVTAVAHHATNEVNLNLFELTLLQKRVQGAIFGGVSPRTQIPSLLEQYRVGNLKLEELVTPYRLEDINQGWQDMRDGKNLRGVIRYTEADY
ncbi:NDMA-dependent alcohol dehydrogenase [Rhodococcus sp. DMU1]|uniref:NDMA-dependent alcohol dehydrogenase n=1 Tax=Rhodococcus sp. DMU1 TaxID=2722825 RepID=UPI00143E7BD1|nr:NDMA-dependent alcohol dehydrogenase [Rhodococcus sp. DMU1]QIX53666.1 NDMA-dependent alcohol dehydrogenase [Rhodococcus sp. DMU1]